MFWRKLTETHQVVGLAAGANTKVLLKQVARWKPLAVGVSNAEAAEQARAELVQGGARLFAGPDAAAEMVRELDVDLVVSGITGAAGLAASLETVRKGLDLALANKESMVVAGPLLQREAVRGGARILPVDSEHSAIFQCLQGQPAEALRRVILTASGGPFRRTEEKELAGVTPEQALDHPTWKMGPKITIDSATLMNKALEVVEARWLFDLDAEQIAVVVHPQSIVHSMVEFRDGSLLAQLGVPDMAVPIRYSLSYPDRSATRDSYFDLERFRTLTFEEPGSGSFSRARTGV